MTKRIFTVGYESSGVDEVIGALKAAGVDILVDVRAVPISRKKGFSKTALSEALEAKGLRYVHLRDLGNPKPGRDAAKRGDFPEYEKVFRTHLAGDRAQLALAEAIRLAFGNKICLLCFERDPATCHRSIVAEAMVARTSMAVEHLVPAEKRIAKRDDRPNTNYSFAFG